MINKKIFFIFCLFNWILSNAQNFNKSDGNCEINVNAPAFYSTLTNNKRAVFRYYQNSLCTGTLINQIVSRGELRQLFISAKHCIKNFDANQNVNFEFNYQSPDGNSLSVPLPNREGGRYNHTSKVKLLAQGIDYALFEIITPIPPHYNVYYAGWNANILPFKGLGILPFTDFHHPRGDIKKASRVDDFNYVSVNNNAVGTVCTVVTDIIDVVCGWFGGNCNTQSVCSYVEIPYITLIDWNAGATESGSSGSALFDKNGLIIGMLNGSLFNKNGCHLIDADNFSKMKTAFVDQSIRPALAPNNRSDFSVGGRDANCYGDISLSGDYYSAKDYQPENKIFITSTGNINTTSNLIVYNNADFVFQAEKSITLNPGFEVQSGANFEAKIGSCSNYGMRVSNIENYLEPVNHNKRKTEINLNTKSIKEVFEFEVFPNPASDDVFFKYNLPTKCKIKINIMDLNGNRISTVIDQIDHEPGEFTVGLNLNAFKPGMYICNVNAGKLKITKKLLIVK